MTDIHVGIWMALLQEKQNFSKHLELIHNAVRGYTDWGPWGEGWGVQELQ
jgi:hypothetical protein